MPYRQVAEEATKSKFKITKSNLNKKEEKNSKKSTDKNLYLFAFRIIGDFGATIAVPVVVFVLAGQWLDNRYNKSPLFTILAFVLAAALTTKIIHKKAKRYGEEYQWLVDRDRK